MELRNVRAPVSSTLVRPIVSTAFLLLAKIWSLDPARSIVEERPPREELTRLGEKDDKAHPKRPHNHHASPGVGQCESWTFICYGSERDHTAGTDRWPLRFQSQEMTMKSDKLSFRPGFRLSVGNARSQAAVMVLPSGGKEGGPDNNHQTQPLQGI